jgi:hypothetical protein
MLFIISAPSTKSPHCDVVVLVVEPGAVVEGEGPHHVPEPEQES